MILINIFNKNLIFYSCISILFLPKLILSYKKNIFLKIKIQHDHQSKFGLKKIMNLYKKTYNSYKSKKKKLNFYNKN